MFWGLAIMVSLLSLLPLSLGCSWPVWLFMEMSLVIILLLVKELAGVNYWSHSSGFKMGVIQLVSGVFLALGLAHNSFLVLVALFMKTGLVPFHWWVLDVFKSWSLGTLLLLSTFYKAPSLLLTSSLSAFTNHFTITALLSLSIASIAGLTSGKGYLMLAWSSITQSSCMSTMSLLLKSGWVFYLFIYACVFLLFAVSVGSGFKLSVNLITVSTPVLLLLMSLAGLPPLLGFLLKWHLMEACDSELMDSYVSFYVLALGANYLSLWLALSSIQWVHNPLSTLKGSGKAYLQALLLPLRMVVSM